MAFGYGRLTDKPIDMQNRPTSTGYTSGGVASSGFAGLSGPAGAGSLKIPTWNQQATPGALERIRQGGEGYQALRGIGLSAPGQSPWEQMMMGRQGTEEASARDLAQSRSAGMGQNIWNQMAMRGGAGLGARERAATVGQRAGFGALQDVARQGRQARSDIGLRGEEQRQGILQMLPGMEMERERFAQGLTQADFENLMKRFELGKKVESSESMAKALERGYY